MTRLFEAKPFIIAEVGSNWRTLDHCLESIRVAKECGADAVKFQAFSYEAMYGFHPGWGDRSSHELSLSWLPMLYQTAKEQGIEFMCTAFSPELVAAVDPYVSVHKVASSDANCPQILEAVAKTGKPVLVSMGAQSRDDMPNATQILPTTRAVYLDCVAAYPADYHAPANYEHSHTIYGGFSDHTLGYTATVEAANRGAVAIEKHFTAFPDLDTPDRPHSLDPKQFKRMVDIIRGKEVESEETAMFLRHKRRLIATQDIQPGQSLRFGVNFGAYRSLEDDTRGASPWDWEKMNGRMAKGPIARGKGVSLEDVE